MTTRPKTDKLSALTKRVDGIEMQVVALNLWKATEDAYKAALKQVHEENEEGKYLRLRDGNQIELNKLLKQAALVVGAILVLLYTYIQTRGIH